MKFFNLVFLAVFLVNPGIAQDRTEWFEFYLPWNDSSESVTNLSDYLDPPAGKYGFVKISGDGHFIFQNNPEPRRFNGVVNVAIANFPTKTEADILAARMAKYGIDLVRIHLIDVDGQYGLFENSSLNTINISSLKLDRMDYFTAALKKRGIYYNFCIQSGRKFKAGDQPDSPVLNDQSKYVTLFNQRLIELQKDYAFKTLAHHNPYTGLSYADDPAMFSVEFTNENSLFNGWYGWHPDYLFGDTEGGIGEFYSEELDSLFNSWLASRYNSPEELLAAWEPDGEDGLELILNNSFENDLASWSVYNGISQGAVATLQTDASNAGAGVKSLKINVTKTGQQDWNVQVKTNEFSVEKNQGYKLSFMARADKNCSLNLNIMENVSWDWFGNFRYELIPGWQVYETYFICPKSSNRLIIQFDYGLTTGTFWLDSVSVTRFGGEGLEEDESLAERNIRRVRYSETGKYSPARIGDNARFYFDLESRYADTMSLYLKEVVGVKCPLTFTNNYYGLASIYSQSGADYMDTHFYWDHPSFPNGWSNTNFTLNNKSMILDPAGSTINRIPLCRVDGKPLVLSEYNHPYPYVFQCEAPSLLYAYGSFHDLDGILWHAYYDYMNNYDQRYQDMFFDIAMNPVIMSQMMLSVPYRTGGIRKAVTRITANYAEQEIFNQTGSYRDKMIINSENGDYGSSFLQNGFAHGSFSEESFSLEGNPGNTGKLVNSDTEELRWDGNQGVFTVNSPYWQGATGYLKDKTIELDNIRIKAVNTTENFGFAAVHLISLDSLPIPESQKLILLTSARIENQGFLWNASMTTPVSVGSVKALCEPVKGSIEMKFMPRDSFYVYRLDEKGQRTVELEVVSEGSTKHFEMDEKTLWYEILNRTRINPVGMSDFKSHDKDLWFQTIPNPCSLKTRVEYNFPVNDKVEFMVLNARGQVVKKETLNLYKNQPGFLELDLASSGPGMYFLGMQFSDGRVIMDKVMVSE